MVKLAWVLAPLAGVAVWLAVCALRGRWPARPQLNAAFSLLLLVYLLGTAGLGLFWVANQELPVFDWHYLFGYTMLAVLAVHLAFNLPLLVRQLRRPRRPGPDARTLPARRPWLWTLGWGAGAALVGYLTGLRHGRTELRPPAAGAGPAADAWGLVELAHRHTAHGRGSLLRRAAGGWATAPPPFKPAADGPWLELPGPTRRPQPARLDATAASVWLWHMAGVSERRGGLSLRTAPSGGALFSTELYLAMGAGDGIAPGWWHYRAERHALQRVADAGPFERLGLPAGAAAVIVATAVFARTGHKYRDRTWRYLLADLGHALENLRRAVAATGHPPPTFLRHFDEQRLAQALALDPSQEGVLAVVALAPARPGEDPDARWSPRPAAPGDGDADELTRALHRLSSLALDAGGVAASALPIVAAAQPAGVSMPLPPPREIAADALGLIARRRSSRRFAARAISRQSLADVLGAMSAPAPVYSSAVAIDLLSASVEGLPAAAWRWHAPSLWRRAEHGDALRARARAAALDQDVIGDAAAVIVLSLRHAAMRADPAGAARGYRHAWLEAGLVGERAYLAATALGLGVCAVGAFYDDELRALVGSAADEWPVHLVALGHPG